MDSTIAIDPANFQSSAPLPYREYNLYAEAEMKLTRHFLIRPGVHFSNFQFRDFGNNSIQPRLFVAYKLNTTQQIYASYNKMTQYLHLLTNPSLGVNSDLWVPSTGLLQPEESNAYDIGYSFKKAFTKNRKFAFTADCYWKQMNNVTNYAEGKSFFINTDSAWEENVETGRGWSYGLELMAEKSGKN